MKKNIILLLITTIMLSCTSDDKSSDSNDSKSNSLNPPEWIKGTWAYESGSPGEYIYIPFCSFKSNDFCTLSGNMQVCIMQAQGSASAMKVTETKTDTDYKFSFTSQGIITSYHFIKISNTKIQYVNPVQGLPDFELFKQ